MNRLRSCAAACVLALLPRLATGQIHFTATLDGAQAGSVSSGTGTAALSLNETLTELRYVVTYQGLSGPLSAAGGHFHYGSAGVSGPVAKGIAAGLAPAAQTFSGSWASSDAVNPLTRAAVESLLTGRVYLNLHTAASPGGEIRGQVTLATALHFVANLDGVQAGTGFGGSGTGVFVLDPSREEVRYRITYRGLSGSLSGAGGHIHLGVPGVTGDVVRTVAPGGGPAEGTVKGSWKSADATQPLTPALVDSLVAGRLYVNFHTAANPGQEIRGQILPEGGYGFMAEIEGDQENPPVPGSGSGTGSFVLSEDRNEVRYAITWANLSGSLSAAGGHLHVGGAGRNGAVVRAIAAGGDSASRTISGVWRAADAQPLTSSLVESLFTGRLYVNLHTPSNPGGEIRGQLEMTTGIGFTSRIDGGQAGTTSGGSGTGSLVLNAERRDLRYSITFFGLSGPLSSAGGHFHAGAPGVSGGVLKGIAEGSGAAAQTLVDDWASSDATQPLSEAAIDSLIAGRIYVNFHSAAFPAGEIRGQLGFSPEVVSAVEQTSDQAIPRRASLDQNYPNPFNPSTQIGFQVAEAGRVSLVVYNLLGQQVAVLVNEVLQPGTYRATFTGAGLPSGIYFYRLTTSFGGAETRRMLFMK